MTRSARALLALLPLALAAAPQQSAPGRSFTFFVASDSHFGARGMSELNRTLVQQMNELPGTEYPPLLGGTVETPRGVLFTGDTTDNGTLEEFAEFEKVYGLTGKEGLLRYPVFETIGNHDVNADSPIKARATERHGAINYSFDWEGVRFLCLDMYPDAATLRWLRGELGKRGKSRPLVLFFHYSLEGNYSDFWEHSEKDAFAQAIDGYNVLAIFHGHEHWMGHYVWRGKPVFRPGAPRHAHHFFLAVRVGARELGVAAWDYDSRRWADAWIVPIRR
jgi:calcineurin-like phosphoesterase family protein